jgi:hypothetical protein
LPSGSTFDQEFEE